MLKILAVYCAVCLNTIHGFLLKNRYYANYTLHNDGKFELHSCYIHYFF